VYPDDARIGVPRVFVSRAVLAAQTPADAIRACLNRRRAAGYNHLIVHESGEMYNVEVSADEFEVVYGTGGTLVHTNHYVAPRMQELEKNSHELIDSRVRYSRVQRLLRIHGGQLTGADVRNILSDHVNYPHSVCNHLDPATNLLDQGQTIVSLVVDLSSRALSVAWGPPCQTEYFDFRFEGA
jgi:isopenicillin-N N-acyltransferase-like protein